MSIAAATRQAYAVVAEAKSTAFREAATQPTSESVLQSVVKWIPSEALGSYIALVGVVAPETAGGRWALFVIGSALVCVFLLLNVALANKQGAAEWRAQRKPGDPPKLAGWRLFGVLAVSLVSFVAWACALPDTPFLTLTSDATQWGGGVAAVWSLLLPKVAELLDLKLPST